MLEEKLISIRGKDRLFVYPHSYFMEEDIDKVLGGEEYPVDVLTDFSPQVILDIGASTGMSSLFFHSRFPDADIYAYEPAQLSHDCLIKNTDGISRIQTFNYGLLDRDEELTLHHNVDGPTGNSIAPQNNIPGAEEVIQVRSAATAVDQLGIERIDILKIDTEGAELRILVDLQNWLSKVEVIFIELHSDRVRAYVDRLLAPHFVLRGAHVATVNRITLFYVSVDALNEGRICTLVAPVMEV